MIFIDKNKYFSDFVSRIENKELKKIWGNDLHFKEKYFDYIFFGAGIFQIHLFIKKLKND